MRQRVILQLGIVLFVARNVTPDPETAWASLEGEGGGQFYLLVTTRLALLFVLAAEYDREKGKSRSFSVSLAKNGNKLNPSFSPTVLVCFKNYQATSLV
jgi:hypothetical protein